MIQIQFLGEMASHISSTFLSTEIRYEEFKSALNVLNLLHGNLNTLLGHEFRTDSSGSEFLREPNCESHTVYSIQHIEQ